MVNLPIHVTCVWVETDDEDVTMVAAEKQCTNCRIGPGDLGTQTHMPVLIFVHFNQDDATSPVKHKVNPCALRRTLATRLPVDAHAAAGERDG